MLQLGREAVRLSAGSHAQKADSLAPEAVRWKRKKLCAVLGKSCAAMGWEALCLPQAMPCAVNRAQEAVRGKL